MAFFPREEKKNKRYLAGQSTCSHSVPCRHQSECTLQVALNAEPEHSNFLLGTNRGHPFVSARASWGGVSSGTVT